MPVPVLGGFFSLLSSIFIPSSQLKFILLGKPIACVVFYHNVFLGLFWVSLFFFSVRLIFFNIFGGSFTRGSVPVVKNLGSLYSIGNEEMNFFPPAFSYQMFLVS